MNKMSETKISSKIKGFPVKRLILSIFAGLIALSLFWGVFFYLRYKPTDEMLSYAGTYIITSSSSNSVTVDASTLGVDTSIELSPDGKCFLQTGDNIRRGLWALDGDTVTIYCGFMSLRGTVSGDSLTLKSSFNAGQELVFTISDNEAEDVDFSAGKYKLTSLDDNGVLYTGSILQSAGFGDWFITISKSGRGTARIFSDTDEDIRVEDDCILLRTLRLDYACDGKTLTLLYPDNVTLTFTKTTKG